MRPQTRYALSGDISIAYQVLGTGPFDLVYSHGWVSHLDMQWDEPHLGSGITFAERGEHTLKGLPDRLRLFAVEST